MAPLYQCQQVLVTKWEINNEAYKNNLYVFASGWAVDSHFDCCRNYHSRATYHIAWCSHLAKSIS